MQIDMVVEVVFLFQFHLFFLILILICGVNGHKEVDELKITLVLEIGIQMTKMKINNLKPYQDIKPAKLVSYELSQRVDTVRV